MHHRHRTHPQLTGWSRYNSTHCDEVGANIDGCSDHDMLNVMDGTVLVNGSPPGRLPRDVAENGTLAISRNDNESMNVSRTNNLKLIRKRFQRVERLHARPYCQRPRRRTKAAACMHADISRATERRIKTWNVDLFIGLDSV
jgi:hypothetical protein